jgi:hypothetical protein
MGEIREPTDHRCAQTRKIDTTPAIAVSLTREADGRRRE